ncbi:MAG: lysophospholipid acyltransferase family protein [Burkholderiaceae bacterium]
MTQLGIPRAQNATTGTTAAELPRLLALLGKVPLSVARQVGSFIGLVSWLASPAYRKKIKTNLALAGYHSGKVPRQAIFEAGRLIAECPYIWSRTPREISRRILMNCSPEHMAEMAAAEKRGKGVLILTPHLGSFEVAARYYAAHRPITVLFKPAKIDFINKWLVAARQVDGINAVPPTVGGLRQMLRTLRQGNIVGLLPDQVPTGGDGEWSRFFGQPAYTMTLPQRLVEMTGCAVVLCVGERLDAGRGWRMHFEPLNEVPTPAVVNARFEQLIRRLPEQYLWGYNRYKVPAGVTPADDPGSMLRDPHSILAAPPSEVIGRAVAIDISADADPTSAVPYPPDVVRQ